MSGIFLAELSAGLLPNLLPSAYASPTGTTLPPLTYSTTGQSFALSTIGAASGFKSLAWTTDPDYSYDGVSHTVELNGSASEGVFTLEAGAQYAVSMKAQVILAGVLADISNEFGGPMSVSILSSSGETVLGVANTIEPGWTNGRVTVLIDRRTATSALAARLKLLSWHAGGTLYLSELTVRKISTAGSKTWYFSNGQGFNRSDGVFYIPRIQQPATVTRSINVAQIGLGAAGGISYGELTLINLDGALDGLDADPVDGRQLRLLYGDDGDDYSQFSTVLVAAIEGYSWERDLLSVRLRDPGAVLDQPVNLNTYTADASVGSFEGYAEIKGKPKPVTFGYVHGVQPVLIDATKRIYQYHDGDATGATLNLYQQNGLSLAAGTSYTSAADVLNDSLKPAPGYFRAYPAQGVFRLSTDAGGLDYQGSIHADINWPSNTASGSLMQMLARRAGLTVAAADVTTLDALFATSVLVGVPAMLGETVRGLLDQVAQGVIGWYGFDALGNLRVGTFRAPSGTPTATLTLSDLDDYSRPVTDPATSLPRWRTTLNLGKNWAPLSKEQIYNATFFGSLAQAYKYTDVRNYYDNKAAHPLATEVTIDTLFKDIVPDMADDLAALFTVRRDTVQVTVNYSGNRFAAIDLNSVVSLAIPRWGYDSGKLMRVIAITDDRQRGKLDLTLWG